MNRPEMAGPFDLVIFDCDGVLVDSERLAVRIEAEALAALGWPLARQMGAEPMRCAVIEDSTSGVEAGVAAGMSVFAFAGGVTPRSKLARAGVEIFDAMGALPGLLSRSTPGSGA